MSHIEMYLEKGMSCTVEDKGEGKVAVSVRSDEKRFNVKDSDPFKVSNKDEVWEMSREAVARAGTELINELIPANAVIGTYPEEVNLHLTMAGTVPTRRIELHKAENGEKLHQDDERVCLDETYGTFYCPRCDKRNAVNYPDWKSTTGRRFFFYCGYKDCAWLFHNVSWV